MGWRIDWEAVRPRHNTGSDRAATAGCVLAAQRAEAGSDAIHVALTYGDPDGGGIVDSTDSVPPP